MNSPQEATSTSQTQDPKHWAVVAARAADEKLGTDIVVIDVGDVLSITDLFVIASGRNRRQVRALCDDIEHVVALAGGPKPRRVEGREDFQWVLMDYGDFVVHVFDDESRQYYELERLWADRPQVPWQESA